VILKAEGRRARKTHHDSLATRSAHSVLGSCAKELGAEAIGNDQTAIGRDQCLSKIAIDCEVELIAPLPVIGPFLIRAKIGAAGLDFHNRDRPARIYRHEIATATVSQRKFAYNGLIQKPKISPDPARDLQGLTLQFIRHKT